MNTEIITTLNHAFQPRQQSNIHTSNITIDAQWLVANLLKCVHINSETPQHKNIPRYRSLPVEFDTDFKFDQLEIKRIYADKKPQTTTEQVISILLNSNIRRGSKVLIQQHIPTLQKQIAKMVSQQTPIKIVLPTLPFKDQNPLTTRHSLDYVDLGEYLHFVQLRNIAASIHSVYAPGIEITLLADGLVYADFFTNGQRPLIEKYRKNCEAVRDQLKLQKNVNIIDMQQLIDNELEFCSTNRQIETALHYFEDKNILVKKAIQSLQRGMLLNISVPEYDFDDYARLINQPFTKLPRSLRTKTHMIAIRYAAFLLTMKRLNVIAKEFPDALRATVHPKNAPQLPIHLVNNHSVTFPYNGVPVVSLSKFQQTKSYVKSTRIVRFYQLLELSNPRAVYVNSLCANHSSEPFYYRVD